MNDDERAIRGVMSKWLEATAAGESATVLGLMSDDVVFLVPGREPFGKAAFAAAQQGLGQFRFQGNSQVRELRVLGDWAFCITDLTVVMTPIAGGPAVRRSGNTLSIFQRLPDGKWVLARDANLLTAAHAGPEGTV
jgi:uncharacterized protein (TIGR02246 family)